MKTKITKRIFAVLLTVVMLLSAVPVGGLVRLDLFGTTASAVDYKVGDIIELGSYWQFYTTLFFDPIKWVVIKSDSQRLLLLSLYALDAVPYHTSLSSVTWETSYLRNWLNTYFYNRAFNENAKKQILTSTIVNEDSSFGVSGGNNTQDKLFCLSLSELQNLLPSSLARCTPTNYAKSEGVFFVNQERTGNVDTCDWWLRSPGKYSSDAYFVDIIGAPYYVTYYGEKGYSDYNGVTRSQIGVRPAMWISNPNSNRSDYIYKDNKLYDKSNKEVNSIPIYFDASSSKFQSIDDEENIYIDLNLDVEFPDINSADARIEENFKVYQIETTAKKIKENPQFLVGSIPANEIIDKISYHPEIKINSSSVYVVLDDGTDLFVQTESEPLATISYDLSNAVFLPNFDKVQDSFNFGNFSETIAINTYIAEFGPLKGTKLYRSFENEEHGHCYGFSVALANLFIGESKLSNFGEQSINNLSRESFSSQYNVSLNQYIKYAQISQFSSIAQKERDNNKGIAKVLSYVKNSINNGKPVPIDMLNGNNHTILAIGYVGNDILVSDSNVPEDYLVLKTNGNNWEYKGWSSKKGNTISYQSGYQTVPRNMGNVFNPANSLIAVPEIFNFIASGAIKIESTESSLSTESSKNDLYWVESNNPITVTNISGESDSFSVSGNECSFDITLSPNAEATVVMSEETEAEMTLTAEQGSPISFVYSTIGEDEENIVEMHVTGTATEATVKGTQTENGLHVSGLSDMTICQKNTNGDVLYEKSDENANGEAVEVIAKHTLGEPVKENIVNATCTEYGSYDEVIYCSECEEILSSTSKIIEKLAHTPVTVHGTPAICAKNGLTDGTKCSVCGEMLTEQQPIPATNNHADNDHNGRCDSCDRDNTQGCDCRCHKGGFAGFIYKIIRIFWKLFRTRQICDCGISHY